MDVLRMSSKWETGRGMMGWFIDLGGALDVTVPMSRGVRGASGLEASLCPSRGTVRFPGIGIWPTGGTCGSTDSQGNSRCRGEACAAGACQASRDRRRFTELE